MAAVAGHDDDATGSPEEALAAAGECYKGTRCSGLVEVHELALVVRSWV